MDVLTYQILRCILSVLAFGCIGRLGLDSTVDLEMLGLSSKCSCRWVCCWRCFSLRTAAALACAAPRLACLLASELTAHSETCWSRSCAWHAGHSGDGEECSIRYSNWCPHCRHLYSKTGMDGVYRTPGEGATDDIVSVQNPAGGSPKKINRQSPDTQRLETPSAEFPRALPSG